MAVAIANCTCSECGAQFERRTKKYNRREADSWVEWAEAHITICPECWKKEKEAEKAEALRQATEGITLSGLVGSAKQVAWAKDIREKFILKSAEKSAGINKPSVKAKYDKLRKKTLQEMTSASWWIEHQTKLESGIIIVMDDRQ